MNFWERILYLLQEYGTSYLKGAGTTLVIALVSTAIGCLIGFIVGIIQTIPEDKQRDSLLKKIVLKIVKIILKIYVEVFRGTPMIVQAVFIYYGAAQIFNIQMGMWQSAFLIVSINTGAYMADRARRYLIDRSGTDRRCKGNWNDTCTDNDQCHSAAGISEYFTADRQQPDHQYQGYFRAVHYQYCRPVLCT